MIVGVPVCVTLGEEFTIVLNDAQSCGTLILIDVTVDGSPGQTQVSATNIPAAPTRTAPSCAGRGDSAARGVTARLETGVAAQASRQHASLVYQPLSGCTLCT